MLDEQDFQRELEKRLSLEWLSGAYEAPIDIDSFRSKIIRGHTFCREPCISRKVCGSEACMCIRIFFSTPEEWDLYKSARSFFLEHLAAALFIKTINEMEEKHD